MYELIPVSEHDYYIDCPAKIGLIRLNDTEAAAIDSGSDKDAAKKILRHVEANGWKLTAVYITHSHADHIGGCKLLQDKTGCHVYARGLEAAYTNSPELEGMTLYGGLPFKELRNKFLMAQPCRAEALTPEVLPAGWELVELSGHCFEMVGFRTPDDTLYLGDCVSSRETLQKYGIGYLWDPAASIATLERVRQMQAARFVPSHAPVTGDIRELAQLNIDAITAVCEKITALCAEPMTFEALLAQLFEAYGLTMNAQQYALIGSTLRSYLSSLYTQGKLTIQFSENRMEWKTI